MRKLGIPSAKDKVIQQAIYMILEAIYDSPDAPYFREGKPATGFDPTTVATRRYEKSEKHGRRSTGSLKAIYALASMKWIT
jgi:hypothetical protein